MNESCYLHQYNHRLTPICRTSDQNASGAIHKNTCSKELRRTQTNIESVGNRRGYGNTQDGNFAQLVGSPVGFQQVVVQVAIAVWHVEQCWSDCQVFARNVLLRHLSTTQYSYQMRTMHTYVATVLCDAQWQCRQ